MAYLILANQFQLKLMYWKCSNPNCNGNRRDKVSLRTACIKNFKLKITKTRTGCQCEGYLYYCENLNLSAGWT